MSVALLLYGLRDFYSLSPLPAGEAGNLKPTPAAPQRSLYNGVTAPSMTDLHREQESPSMAHVRDSKVLDSSRSPPPRVFTVPNNTPATVRPMRSTYLDASPNVVARKRQREEPERDVTYVSSDSEEHPVPALGEEDTVFS